MNRTFSLLLASLACVITLYAQAADRLTASGKGLGPCTEESALNKVGAWKKGLLRVEGKEYVVKDGDVMHFRFNV